jgi:hypothetical protein
MTPIYFPYTYVSQETARAVAGFFKRIVVYQPSAKHLPAEMQPLVEDGFLDVRIPDKSDPSRFDDVVQKFERWGNLHTTSEEIKAASLPSITDPIPFFNNSAASQIVTDVKRKRQQTQTSKASEPTFDARVFLEFAQQFDRQYHKIHGDLGAYDDKIRHLFAEIKGEGDQPVNKNLSGPGITDNNPAEYMALKRLEAWVCLFKKDAIGSGIFLTPSRLVMEHILDNTPSAEKVHTLTSLPVPGEGDDNFKTWQENLLTGLTTLAKANWPAPADIPLNGHAAKSSDPHVSLSIYLMPDLMPYDCFGGCVSETISSPGGHSPPIPIRNTLIGLIQSREAL